MAELFPETGQPSDVAASPPNLRGVFLPGLDQATFVDGFGLITPFGGGGSLRNYQTYGPSAEVRAEETQLRDISQALGAFGGGDTTYNLEGFVGPTGPPGPAGPPGIPGVGIGSLSSPNGIFGLHTTLDQIALLGTAPDQMIYTIGMEYTYTWVDKTPSGLVGSFWRGIACDDDGANVILAVAGARIYLSTDYGDSWVETRPKGDVDEGWNDVASDSDGSNLIVCASGDRIYISDDSGSSWSETRPDGDTNYTWTKVDSDRDGSALVVCRETTGKVYLSTNSGTSWSEVQPAGATTKNWNCLACDGDGSVIVAGVNGGRIYYSDDTGVSWTEAAAPAGGTNRNWADASCSDTGVVIAAIINNGYNVYVSNDKGVSWNLRVTGASTGFATNVSVSGNGQVILASYNGDYNFVSFDAGVSWTPEIAIGGDGKEDWYSTALNFYGDIGYVSSDRGDEGRVFASVSTGVPIWAETTITGFGRSLVDDATAEEARDTLILGTGDSPEFTGLTLSGLTDNALIYPSSGVLTSLAVASNGQLPVGSTGATPVLAELTGTANQIIITNGAGSITLTTPQDIGTASSVTFGNVTDSALTQSRVVLAGASGLLADSANLTFDGSDLESAKFKLTAIGGLAVKLTNTTGANTIAGQLVKADPATNDAVILAAAGDVECIGVFLDSDVADDAEAWVVVSGIADVAHDDNVAAVRGNWVATGVLAGYARTSASPAAAPNHFEEVGHCIESVAADGGGTHILARCILHFN